MERTIIRKIVALITVIMVMAADFVILGSNLISYATTQDSLTNNENVEFSAYFKTYEGTKVDNISKSIKSSEMKMYAEIKIKNEGYFNGNIEILESNFKIKNDILSDSISSIEGNKINLKQINAGNTVEIEIGIEPITDDRISSDMMSKDTTIKLSGQYMEETYEGVDIEATKTIRANFEIEQGVEAEVGTEIITNEILPIRGANKRIIQLAIKSNIQENQYPIKQTKIEVEFPKLSEKEPEEIKVLSLGTKATNGKGSSEIEDFERKEGKLLLTIKNEPDEENKIEWNKKERDGLIVTLIYDEAVEANTISVTTNTEIELYNTQEKKTATDTQTIENKTMNKTLITQTGKDSGEIYKGQLYVNSKTGTDTEVNYKTKTKANITNSDIVDKVILNEGPDAFITQDEKEVSANTRFISTEINKEKMLEILGESGTIQINDGTNITSISKQTETDENGNIIIEYAQTVAQLEITLSKPQKAGIFEIAHNKAITKSSYKFEQLKTIKQLELISTIRGLIGETPVVENTTKTPIELKETETKAELTVDRESLSTISTENEVILGIKLITNGVQYDLYKNPKITIQLPDTVEEVTSNGAVSKLYDDEFKIKAIYNKETKRMEISLEGEQTSYPTDEALQAYLQFNLNLKLRKLAPSKVDKIVMTYTNENAKQYAGGTTEAGVVEKEINISSPSGLIPVNSIEGYNVEGITGISANKQVANIDRNTSGGADITYKIELANNTDKNVNNIRILGTIPTKGTVKLGTEEIENTLETVLKSVNAQGATVYYSSNANATADLNNSNNGWNSNLQEVGTAKSYLIVVENIERDGRYNATYTVTLSKELEYNQTSYAGYQVFFNEEGDVAEKKESSTLIGISTGNGPIKTAPVATEEDPVNIETSLTAKVGMDELNDGDTVKAGEVVRYTLRVKNNGTKTLKNISAKAGVPEGTVWVEPDYGDLTADDLYGDGKDMTEGLTEEELEDLIKRLGFVYSGNAYYLEKTDIKETTQTIESLEPDQEVTFSYEVRVNMDITNGTQVTNKATITCNKTTIESNELTAKLSEAKFRASMKVTNDLAIVPLPGADRRYYFFIENESNETLKNINAEIVSEGLDFIFSNDEDYNDAEIKDGKIKIKDIAPKSKFGYEIIARIQRDTEHIGMSVKLTDENGQVYRSNVYADDVGEEGATISLSTPNEGGQVSIGEEIKYNFTVENTSSVLKMVDIEDEVPEYLEVVRIEVNGRTEMQTQEITNTDTYKRKIENHVRYGVELQPKKKAIITIVARVKEEGNEFSVKTITNSGKVLIGGEEYGTSEEVSHVIKGKYLEEDKSVITGLAWFDGNGNGAKDTGEPMLPGIKVLLYDITSNSIAKDKEGNRAETTTDANGEYIFKKIEPGKYLVLFDFDKVKYEVTGYKMQGVPESRNSNAILKSITIEGKEEKYGVTDTINLGDIVANINIGLKDNYIYDLELHKYISKIIVQNPKETKTYDYSGKDSTFQKVEINRKQLNNSTVILEYTIRVKNTGILAGNVNSIVDYLPEGLNFSSELNPDWYLSDKNLHTRSLANDKIQPGETRELKLILTKKMTENSTGLVNNRAEIEESFNELGKKDIDSTENNQAQGEDDLGSADVIISVSTGIKTVTYTIIMIANITLIACAIILIFKKNKDNI